MAYNRINWEDSPSTKTPISAENLRHMEDGIVYAVQMIEQLLANKTSARIGQVTLYADAWQGEDNKYSQVVDVSGVTENSQVDLTPSAEQLTIFHEKDIAFVTENDGGEVTVFAIGQKPQNDYTMQVTITEVQYE